MQIVIDIDKDQYSRIMQSHRSGVERFISKEAMMYAIKNGTPLPNGHGDLIDADRKITIYIEEYGEWEEKKVTVREALNRLSDEEVTEKDIIVLADKV